MSVRFKILFLFLGLYGVFAIALTSSSILVVRELLQRSTIEYIDYQVAPILDFYKTYYKNPHHYMPMLVEDVVSRDLACFLFDRKGNLIKAEGFLEGETPTFDQPFFLEALKRKSGVIGNYAYRVKEIEGYKLLLIAKLERVRQVERKIIYFIVAFTVLLFPPLVLVSLFLTNNLLKPLYYLTHISQRISSGEIGLDIKRSGRKDEFGLLENAYYNMVNSLRETIMWQREFIRNITHALKTPLTYIKGQTELIQKGIYTSGELQEVFKNLHMQALKMEKLINQLALLFRLESSVPLNLERTTINQLFAELEEEYEFIRRERNFVVEYLSQDKEIITDREYLKIAIRNIIENAYKYTNDGGFIRLYFSDNCIVVEDNGRGMEHPEKAGELFYREAYDKEGFGLGLSIVKAVANRLGFRVLIESKKDYGTKVSLCII